MAARGRFITFEGGEGTGKSTQIRRLHQTLSARGLDVAATREPGGTPGAEAVRGLLVDGEPGRWDAATETLLHVAARRDHVTRFIAPALEAGRWVLSDRFADSTMAYQGYAHGLDLQAIREVHEFFVPPLRPDLTFVLDIPVETGLARAAGRQAGGTRYEQMDVTFHQRVRDGFRAIAAEEPDRCRLVDAHRSVDEVAAEIAAAVTETFFVQELRR